MPRDRDGVRRYFEQMRPRLAASEATQQVMHYLLGADVVLPPMPRVFRPAAKITTALLRTATVATLPRWQRRLANLHQPRLVDALIRPVMKPAFRVLAQPRVSLLALKLISPSTVPVVAAALRGVPPRRAEVLTPADAFARHGTCSRVSS